MAKPRTLANTVSTGGPLEDGTIGIAEVTGLQTALDAKAAGTPATASVGGELKLYEATDNGTNYVSFKAPNTLAGNVTWSLPSVDGTNGQVLATNGSGTLAWASIASTGVQYTDIGTAPNQIPLNQTLGSMAYQNADGINVGAIYANRSATFASPGANVSITIGRQGDGIYYNGLVIWAAYNGSYPMHTIGQDYQGSYYQVGGGFRFIFPTGGGGVSLAYNGTSWTSLSDERLKNVTGGFDNACAAVDALKAFKFSWKYDPDNKPKVGLSAQSVAAVLPEATAPMSNPVDKEDKTEYLGVNYTELVPLLVAAIQELNAEIRKLKGL